MSSLSRGVWFWGELAAQYGFAYSPYWQPGFRDRMAKPVGSYGGSWVKTV
ncbi:hypothetical protein ACN2CC_26145 [Mesorhizobium muleiense]